MKKVDIIASCYNEEDNIAPFFNETIKYLNDDRYIYNILYVNDGSVDKTYEKVIELRKKLKEEERKNIKVSIISFIHNFGHEAAMCAGLNKSDADYLIFIDVDLQNPPQKIPEIMKEFEKGADCVLMRRVKYSSASLIKKFFSKSYYLFSTIVLRNKNERDVSDFFAIDKEVARAVSDKYNTRLRFIRSFVQKEAKNIAIVDYENAARNSGESRYNFFKLSKLAIISELSRMKFLRDRYKATNSSPIYIVDEQKTIYELGRGEVNE